MSAQPVVWNESELETVTCSNCGAGADRQMCVRADGLPVVECLRCGLAYVSPRPRPAFVSRLYGRDYFQKESGSTRAVGYADYLSGHARKVALARLDLLEKHRPLRGARVLEIGCATGDLLAEMRCRGASVTGLEMSRWAAETAWHRYGIEVLVGTLDSLGDSSLEFDAIVALEVIEHVGDPREFLLRLSRLLAPAGVAMVSTPNYRCARSLGAQWAGFQRSFEHLCFLSDEVLSRIAAAAGLLEEAWYTSGNGKMAACNSTGARSKLRRLLKTVPGATRVWSLLRQTSSETRHVPYGHGHGLVTIFRKEPGTACSEAVATQIQ